jgi:hypothetical protein
LIQQCFGIAALISDKLNGGGEPGSNSIYSSPIPLKPLTLLSSSPCATPFGAHTLSPQFLSLKHPIENLSKEVSLFSPSKLSKIYQLY